MPFNRRGFTTVGDIAPYDSQTIGGPQTGTQIKKQAGLSPDPIKIALGAPTPIPGALALPQAGQAGLPGIPAQTPSPENRIGSFDKNQGGMVQP